MLDLWGEEAEGKRREEVGRRKKLVPWGMPTVERTVRMVGTRTTMRVSQEEDPMVISGCVATTRDLQDAWSPPSLWKTALLLGVPDAPCLRSCSALRFSYSFAFLFSNSVFMCECNVCVFLDDDFDLVLWMRIRLNYNDLFFFFFFGGNTYKSRGVKEWWTFTEITQRRSNTLKDWTIMYILFAVYNWEW